MSIVFEETHEPVEVLTHFENGRVHPLRFRWRGRVYRIQKVHGNWSQPKGVEREYHFSVLADNSDTFELVFDTTDFRWHIVRVATAA